MALISHAVVILAAGRSRRMGRSKLLLPWGPGTVLAALIEQWQRTAPQQIVIVCAADDRGIEGELDRLRFPQHCRVFNPEPERGMFSSIQYAAAWTGWQPDVTHWIISLGDQPQIEQSTLNALLRFAGENRLKVCQPMRLGRRKHPVVLPRRIFGELKHSPATDFRHFLEHYPNDLTGFESEDVGLDWDIDTSEDYDAAWRYWVRLNS